MSKSKVLKRILPVMMADSGVTYYVDATSGDDANTGLTSGDPWKSIAKVAAASLNPGDKVLFKRGEVWRSRLRLTCSGSAGKHIVFGAYGTGDKPILSGAELLSSWNDEGGNIWNAALNPECLVVWFDEDMGTKVANKPALAANDDWFWDTNVLYIYSDSDPGDKVIEGSNEWQCIDQNELSYLRFENLKVEKSRGGNIRIDGDATDIIISNVDCAKAFQEGIYVGVAGGAAVTPSNVVIEDCTVTLCNREDQIATPAIHQWLGTSGGDNLVIRNCTISSDIDVVNSGFARDGIMVDDGDNVLIENNSISDFDHGIQMRGSLVDAKDVDTFVIRYNRIEVFDDAIWLNGTDEADSEIYYNLLVNTGDQHFDIIGEGGKIYNNTCYGGQSNAIALQNDASSKVIFKNNIISHHANNKVIVNIDDTAGVDIANSTFDNNCYYRAAPAADFWDYDGGGGGNFADWQSTHSMDANGINENPLYTDFGTDFTLQAGSGCRDAGVDVGLTRDYPGESVPQETNPAIGAYEYTG